MAAASLAILTILAYNSNKGGITMTLYRCNSLDNYGDTFPERFSVI
jgi:hypothetical protein